MKKSSGSNYMIQRPLKTRLTDKFLVPGWIKEKIGEEYLIPLLSVYNNFDVIDFDVLPDRFVLKANHGSGWNIIVTDKKKLDMKKAKNNMESWLRTNFAYKAGLELHYKDIMPRIIIEKYIGVLDEVIYDFRVFCFNGEPKAIWVDAGSGTSSHTRNIYDLGWNIQAVHVSYPPLQTSLEKPPNLAHLLDMSRILSEGFPIVRVDFYDLMGGIYFGEMTFTPQSGIGDIPEDYGKKLGDWIKLPPLTLAIVKRIVQIIG